MAWAVSIGRGLKTLDVPSHRSSADRASAKVWRQGSVALGGAEETVLIPFGPIENRAIRSGGYTNLVGPVVLCLNALATEGVMRGDRL